VCRHEYGWKFFWPDIPAYLRADEEGILASFTRSLIDIAAVSGARGSATSPIAALNAMGLPATAIDGHGFVVDANTAAESVFDDNIRIKDRRLFVRDQDSRNLLKQAIDQLASPPRLNALAVRPVVHHPRVVFSHPIKVSERHLANLA
jgi:hypothetical protein